MEQNDFGASVMAAMTGTGIIAPGHISICITGNL